MSEKYQKLDNKMVGQMIKALRKTKRISVIEFSERTGICRSYITMVEQGDANPSVDIIVTLFAGLGKEVVFGVKRFRIQTAKAASTESRDAALLG